MNLNAFSKSHFMFIGYILILASAIKCSKKDGNQLRCYKCGQGDYPSCNYFNETEVFITICPKDQKSCLKGWVNRSGGSDSTRKDKEKQTSLQQFVRGCAPIAENICLKQNSGFFYKLLCQRSFQFFII